MDASSENFRMKVFADRSILSGEQWIFYVRHDALDGGWQFHPSGHMDRSEQDVVTTTLGEIMAIDDTVTELNDLPAGWHAHRQTQDAPWARAPAPQGTTYAFSFEAVPTEDHPEYGEIAGAFICIWMRTAMDFEAAQEHAAELIAGAGWEIVDEDWATEVWAGDLSEDDDRYPYFRQVQVDGEVWVINAFESEE